MGNYEAVVTVTITDGQNVTTRTDACHIGGNLKATRWDGSAEVYDVDYKALAIARTLIESVCRAARNEVK